MSTLATKLLSSKIDVLKNKILDSCALKGIDPALFVAPEDSVNPLQFPMITSSLFNTINHSTINPDKQGDRFAKEVRFYKSTEKNIESKLWDLQNNRDFMSCDMGDSFYANLMPEVYKVQYSMEAYTPGDYFVDHNLDHTPKDQEESVLSIVNEHESFIEVCGVGSLIYTDLSKRFSGLDNEHFCRTMMLSKPYSTSPTMHEAFKNLLEWQWAYNELGYTEPMAELANNFLTALGLSYLDESTNEVVGSLMALPDQSLAQEIKTGDCHINEEEPECPAEFVAWCKDIMELITFSYEYKAVSSRL